MPELAEVEFFRKQWDAGLDKRIAAVLLHPDKRVFRGTDAQKLQQVLPGSRLLASEAHGKQMLFRFSHGIWLGLHLGMTGKLRAAEASFKPSKHDHLVLAKRVAPWCLTMRASSAASCFIKLFRLPWRNRRRCALEKFYRRTHGSISPAASQTADQGGVAPANRFPGHWQLDG